MNRSQNKFFSFLYGIEELPIKNSFSCENIRLWFESYNEFNNGKF